MTNILIILSIAIQVITFFLNSLKLKQMDSTQQKETAAINELGATMTALTTGVNSLLASYTDTLAKLDALSQDSDDSDAINAITEQAKADVAAVQAALPKPAEPAA